MNTVEAATGKWVGILSGFGIAPKYLRNKHTECPLCGGKDRYRFDDKNGQGSWICNACGAGYGMDLLMRVTGWDFKHAAKEVDKVVANVKAVVDKVKPDPVKYLRKIQEQATNKLDGTPVEKYLKSRGINFLPKNIQYIESLKYYDDGKLIGSCPAMLCKFDGVDGKPLTFHATYLTQDGEKASLPAVRKFMPAKSELCGGAIRFGNSEELHIAEGVESALSVMQLYNVVCWAVGNATLMEKFEVPVGVKKLIICADNDANYTGQKSAYNLAHKLSLKGVQVSVLVPDVIGSDFNDLVKK